MASIFVGIYISFKRIDAYHAHYWNGLMKISFIGAGSTVFAKNVLGDVLCVEALQDCEIALYDMDAQRLDDSFRMVQNLNAVLAKGKATITAHCGVEERRAALKDADYVINAIQVGGYKPATVIDFEIPKKYGLKQTIADTLGIGGLFRNLRTLPVLMDIAADMQAVCPDAWFLNYTNPMAVLTGAMLRLTDIRTVGLCHSVQACVPLMFRDLEMSEKVDTLKWQIAGINHQAWLLEISQHGRDLYPEIKKRAFEKNQKALNGGDKHHDMVRYKLMQHFGYYITESSEHNAEYCPFFIKKSYPELIEQYNIPIDEYITRCEVQIKDWEKQRVDLVDNKDLTHERTHEYGSFIIEAMETDVPARIHGNVLNNELITNLPSNCVVEVACLVDRNGIQGTHVGALPEQCAAYNRTNVNTQLMTIEAFRTKKKDALYQAAMLDPHTAAELSLDDIVSLCDDLIEAHGDYLPSFA